MTRRNFISLLLALALLAGAAAPARCAGQPTLICDTGEEPGVVSLRLEDLEEDGGVYGVQLELTLDGEYPGCTFTPDSRSAYSPDCLVGTGRGKTTVVIYLTGRSALDRDGVLDLGKLDLGISGMVDWDVLPETVGVVLLDHQLRASDRTLPVTATAPAGTGGGSWEEPQLPTDYNLPFTDVAAADWFYGAVQYVYAHGIMSGTEPGLFSPGETASRGMTVTMLCRLEGSPAAPAAAFTDVYAGDYYAGPVAWASASGIVNGTSDSLFSPNDPVTREQLAAILYRYARYKGLDVSVRGDLSRFPDASRVSGYAVDALSWAVGAGLISGSDGLLDPGGDAQRAQVAAIFQRMCVGLLGMV